MKLTTDSLTVAAARHRAATQPNTSGFWIRAKCNPNSGSFREVLQYSKQVDHGLAVHIMVRVPHDLRIDGMAFQ